MTGALDQGLRALLRGDPRLARDPYPFYCRLRNEAPVYRLGSFIFVSTHAEAKATFLDSQHLANKPNEPVGSDAALSLLSESEEEMLDGLRQFELGCISRKDGLDHARVRAVVQPAFARPLIGELEETAQRLTERLLDELAQHEHADLIELAYRLPLLVIMSMLGAPHDDGDVLARWGNSIFAPKRRERMVQPDLVRRADRALKAYRTYVCDFAMDQPSTPLGEALLMAAKNERLTPDELVATYALILHAGHETTAHLIGNGLLALLEHRNQWRLLCNDLSLAEGAVEEAFRYDTPVQIGLRTAVTDFSLNGVHISAGTPVWVLIGAANRDPKVFANPNELDIKRHPNVHLGFGHGAHHCLGAPLARLQARIVFSTLAARFPGTELVAAPQTLPRTTGLSMRGLVSLPVKL